MLQIMSEKKPFDLHMHTTASDGVYSPAEMVRKGHEAGLKLIAITDHDTLAGIEEGKAEAEKLGITFISGVEISTKYEGISVDILGYGVTSNARLNDVLLSLRDGREDRALRIIQKFNDIGMPITMEDVLEFSGKGVIARPHIARAIVKKGYVNEYQKVFDDYLADGKPCCIDKVILTPQEGIELIRESGGVAVLAHPVLIGDDELVGRLIEENHFDGIEVWHRKQDFNDQKRYMEMAQQYGLMTTGGSDFHTDEHKLGQFGINWNEIIVDRGA